MPLTIKTAETNADYDQWDSYVNTNPNANLYHLSGWKTVVENAYGHKTYYLMALRSQPSVIPAQSSTVGILPLVHMRHFLFGNKLVSIPFFDMGGVLADDDNTAISLVDAAIDLGRKLKVDTIELRQDEPLQWLENKGKGSNLRGFEGSREIDQASENNSTHQTNIADKTNSTLSSQLSAVSCATMSSKVRMLLDLPDSIDDLMQSFKSKLRSQIKRPTKDGLTYKFGSPELIDAFYSVFCINMRDLGSPVHSKKLLHNVLQVFSTKARILIVYTGNTPVACSLIVGFKDILENPWASSLREFSRFAPNMLLYWAMLSYACENRYHRFDFGRSTPGEGTFKFKSQWGAMPKPLFWYALNLDDRVSAASQDQKSKFGKAIQYWQKLPVSATRIIGPMIRKHIAL